MNKLIWTGVQSSFKNFLKQVGILQISKVTPKKGRLKNMEWGEKVRNLNAGAKTLRQRVCTKKRWRSETGMGECQETVT